MVNDVTENLFFTVKFTNPLDTSEDITYTARRDEEVEAVVMNNVANGFKFAPVTFVLIER